MYDLDGEFSLSVPPHGVKQIYIQLLLVQLLFVAKKKVTSYIYINSKIHRIFYRIEVVKRIEEIGRQNVTCWSAVIGKQNISLIEEYSEIKVH